MKPILRKLHRVLGLSVGLWAALTALTGSVLVFSDEIDRALNPGLLQVEPQREALDVDQAIAAVLAQFPGETVRGLRLPQAADEPLLVRIGGEPLRNVYVDPYTADVLGVRSEHGGVMGFLWDFHVHLLAGETGETVAGVLALVLIGMLISGVVLWWPAKRSSVPAFKVRWTSNSLLRMFDLHRVAGVMAAPLVLIVVVTGAMLVFHQTTTAWLVGSLGGPARTPPAAVAVPGDGKRQSLAQMIANADAALPDAYPTFVSIPPEPGAPVVVRQRFEANPHPNGRSFVAVDPYTAKVVQVHDWRTAGTGVRVSDYKYPLHIGEAFGLPGRVLTLLIGLMPPLLLCTGVFVWWRKRRLRAVRSVSAYRSGASAQGVSQ